MTRRRVAIALAVALVAGSLAAVAAWRWRPAECLDQVVPAQSLERPLPQTEDDPRLARLVTAAEGWGEGSVVGAVGYDYDRYIDLAALPRMFAVWRKDDPVMMTIDAATGDPRWGIRQAQVRHTWDASAERFMMLAAPQGEPIEVSSHAMDSGERRWCVRLDQPPVGADDPITTRVDEGNNVLVLAGKVGEQRLTMLAGDDGRVQWTRKPSGIDRGAYLSGEWSGVSVIGGRPTHELGEPPADSPEVLAGINDKGSVVWRHKVEAGATASVVGDLDGQVVVREAINGRHRLLMLDQATGREQWQVASVPATSDVAVRGSRVLIRTTNAIRALDIGTGKPAWRIPVRQQPQQFPYGFRLSSQPMLDGHTLLLGSTDALIEVDLRNGSQQRMALPVDGISTTYWPYQVVIAGPSLGVVTNTGAVVIDGSGATAD